MKRPVDDDDDDEAEGWNLPQKKKVKFQEGEDDEADEQPSAGRLHDDEDDDEPIKKGRGDGMAGNDDEVSVKVQGGRIKHMEGPLICAAPAYSQLRGGRRRSREFWGRL